MPRPQHKLRDALGFRGCFHNHGDATKILGFPMDPRGTTRFLHSSQVSPATLCYPCNPRCTHNPWGSPRIPLTASETCLITLKTPLRSSECAHSPQTLLRLPQSCHSLDSLRYSLESGPPQLMRWLQEPDLPSAVTSVGPSGGGFACAVSVTLLRWHIIPFHR